MKHYEVVAAVIKFGDKILCMQRNYSKFPYTSYKFEFPGGKIEPGEERHEALERELREEMDMNVSIKESDYLMTVEHEYPDFAITMHAFLCVVDKPDFVMKEHKSFEWLPVEKMPKLDWAEADKPILKFLADKNL